MKIVGNRAEYIFSSFSWEKLGFAESNKKKKCGEEREPVVLSKKLGWSNFSMGGDFLKGGSLDDHMYSIKERQFFSWGEEDKKRIFADIFLRVILRAKM